MENFIDFNAKIKKEVINQYAGSERKKTVILEDENKYLLKFPDNVREKNAVSSYINNVLSEYIGCKIAATMGLSVQEVILGTYRVGEKTKLACACKDVCKEGEELHEFSKMQLSDLSSSRKPKSILLDDVCDAISRNQYVDPKEMLEFYYKQFVFDALIGNTDRHNGNWGVIADKDGNCRISPIFDCGSSLDPLVPEEEMNKQTAIRSALSTVSAISDNKGRISYKEYFEKSDSPLFIDALKSLAFSIDIAKIKGVVDEIPPGYISENRREFYKTVLEEKYNKMFIPAFKKNLFLPLQESDFDLERKTILNKIVSELEKKDIGGIVSVETGEGIALLRKVSNKQVLVQDSFGKIVFTSFKTDRYALNSLGTALSDVLHEQERSMNVEK